VRRYTRQRHVVLEAVHAVRCGAWSALGCSRNSTLEAPYDRGILRPMHPTVRTSRQYLKRLGVRRPWRSSSFCLTLCGR